MIAINVIKVDDLSETVSDFQKGVLLELLQRNEPCAGVTNKYVVVVGLENVSAGEIV